MSTINMSHIRLSDNLLLYALPKISSENFSLAMSEDDGVDFSSPLEES